jgi:hypothetical protein
LRSLDRWRRGFPLLFLIEGNLLVDGPQPAFALLGNLLESIVLLEVMPDTTLPAVTVHAILVVRVLFAYLVIDLLQLKTFGRSFG